MKPRRKSRGDVRGAIFRLVAEEGLKTFTVDDLGETGFPKKVLSNALYHCSRSGLVTWTGRVVDGNKKVWEVKGSPLPQPIGVRRVKPEEEKEEFFDFNRIGREVVNVLRHQDQQLRENNKVIAELIEERKKLVNENTSLKLKLNEVTNGRVTVRELMGMRRVVRPGYPTEVSPRK